MKIKDESFIDCLKQVESNNNQIQDVKLITYQVAVAIGNRLKIDNPRFNTGEFLMKML